MIVNNKDPHLTISRPPRKVGLMPHFFRAFTTPQKPKPSDTNMLRKSRKPGKFRTAFASAGMALALALTTPAIAPFAGTQAYAQQPGSYSSSEILNAGHGFFGSASSGLASLVERAVSSYGLPNGYILGEEASGALVGGLRYGEGSLFTKNAGDHKVYWQGPSVGWDFGGDGNRTMMLVYNLTNTEKLFRRYVGVSGSAYLVGGLGMTVLKHGDTILVPVRTGVGARLGVNIGYLKMLPYATWNPF